MGLFRLLVLGLFIVAVPVALVTTNIRAAISEQRVYDYSVRTYNAERVSGIPESELLRANGELRHYLVASDPGPLAITVRDQAGDEVSLFNARETAHMVDVRDLVQGMFTVHVIVVALILTLAVVMLVIWPPRALAAAALYGALLTGAVIAIIGLIAVTGFDGAWTRFHLIAFSNDLWRLNSETDRLIQMFPEAFWQRITILIGVFTMLQAAVIAGVASVYLYLSRPRPSLEDEVVKPRPSLAGAAGPTEPRRYVH